MRFIVDQLPNSCQVCPNFVHTYCDSLDAGCILQTLEQARNDNNNNLTMDQQNYGKNITYVEGSWKDILENGDLVAVANDFIEQEVEYGVVLDKALIFEKGYDWIEEIEYDILYAIQKKYRPCEHLAAQILTPSYGNDMLQPEDLRMLNLTITKQKKEATGE